jgi:hypothetical protein
LRSLRRFLTPGVLVGATLALASCGIFSGPESRPCPRVSVVAEASTITSFAPGGGRDLTDVQFEGELGLLASSCRYDTGSITSTAPVRVVATRGAALPSNQVTLAFFLAVIDVRSQQVLARERFESALVFQGNQRRAGVVEEIEQVIRLRTPQQIGEDYEVLIGFELEPEQLQFNRQRRGRR